MTAKRLLIVGAGLAGAKAAEALREQGFDGPVTLLGAEPLQPYSRPPLSKEYLRGKEALDNVFVHDEHWYAEHDIDLRTGVEAAGIDRAARRVGLTGGGSLAYDALLLATGAHARPWPDHADELRYLRTVTDSDELRRLFADGPDQHLLVIGGGWIGLEVAAAAREAGLRVTVLESAALPLLQVLGPEVARVYAEVHREHGVDLRTDVDVVAADRHGVRLRDGTRIDADAVLAGIGAVPNVELARAAGLEIRNGIVVDAALRTADPAIFAAGDVANAYHPLLQRHIRVEHWANALNQPAVAAAGMLGKPAEYTRLPYFYSDQYELGMEYRGYVEPDGYDRVVFRGDPKTYEFIAFWLKDGRVLAGMNVNIWDVGQPIETLIRSRKVVPPEQLADTSVPLTEIVK